MPMRPLSTADEVKPGQYVWWLDDSRRYHESAVVAVIQRRTHRRIIVQQEGDGFRSRFTLQEARCYVPV